MSNLEVIVLYRVCGRMCTGRRSGNRIADVPLAVPQLAVSTVLVTVFTRLLKVDSANAATAVKVFVDAGLFVASFFIQKHIHRVLFTHP